MDPREIRRKIAGKVKAWRETKGIRLNDAASAIGVPTEELASYEDGTAGIPLYILAKLTELYEADPFEILAMTLPQDPEEK